MIRPLFALFIRSLREDTRAKFTPIIRASIVLVILFFVFVNQRSLASQTAPGLHVFFIVMLINLCGLVLGGITAFCSAITEEKEDDTLGLLRMTNLNPVAILLGKGTSRFVSGALLLISQLPFTLLCVTLGGISAAQIWKGYVILLCTLFLLCNLGLLMSVISRTTAMSVAFTLLAGVILYVGFPFVFFLGQEIGARSTPSTGLLADVSAYCFSVNPFIQIGTLVYGAPGAFFPPIPSPVLFHAIFGTACFLLSWLLFGRFCSGTQETAPRKKNVLAARGTTLRIPRPGAYAIAWKEFWFPGSGRRGLIFRYLTFGLLNFGIITPIALSNTYVELDDIGEMLMSFSLLALGVEILLASARIFGSERKELTLSSLITVPISLKTLVRQKMFGTLPVLIPSLTYFLAGAMLAPRSVLEFFDDLSGIRSREVWLLTYLLMHLITLPLLTCWMSLKLRRGVVAASLCIAAVWNIIGSIVGDELNMEEEFCFAGTVAFVIFAGVFMRKIAASLSVAASAD